MKYLKRYNESKDTRSFYFSAKPEEGELEELRDFCETHLAYLVDKDFVVDVSNDFTHKNFHISILKEGSKYKGFTWDEIKDYFIPFLTHLSRKYEICYESVRFNPLVNGLPKTYTSYDVDRIISEEYNFSDLETISEVSIDIEYKMNIED